MLVFLKFPICLSIDLRIITKRRLVLFICGIGQCICIAAIFTDTVVTPNTFFLTLCVDCLFGLIISALRETLLVEQGRKDIVNGMGDLSTIGTMFSVVGAAIGCIIGTCLIDMHQPKMSYTICFFLVLLQAIVSIFMSEEIDSNPLATGKDKELIKYEREQRRIHPDRYSLG